MTLSSHVLQAAGICCFANDQRCQLLSRGAACEEHSYPSLVQFESLCTVSAHSQGFVRLCLVAEACLVGIEDVLQAVFLYDVWKPALEVTDCLLVHPRYHRR
ncbi:hypothetical protein DPMN_149143 [Dreissena polymorpha]|uniref:Uncharacterized protein n=1 Tax=Dreissena polymorpha TaxID=45954 RepID=A0A9D4J4N7_DREPO|nr:hypothetical protein DPMN_149143 [Dreissena polymorpha]